MKKIIFLLFFSNWWYTTKGQENWTKEYDFDSTGSISEIHFLNAKEKKEKIMKYIFILIISLIPFHYLLSQDIEDYSKLRLLSKKEMFEKTAPTHSYGDLILTRVAPLVYEYKDLENQIQVREHYPGILFYSTINTRGGKTTAYNCFQLDFYSENKQKIKSLDLKKDSPYQKRDYNIISTGYPNREYYHFSKGDSEKMPDSFSTVNEVNSASNGFTIVEYQLISLRGYKILGWEETLKGLDKNGNEIFCMTVPFDTHDCRVSDDGKYLMFTYGGSRSDDPKTYNNGGMRIYDIASMEIIYEEKDTQEKKIKNIVEVDNGYILMSYFLTEKDEIVKSIALFDFKNRSRYEKAFSKTDWKKIGISFKSFTQLMEDYSFKTTKF